MYGHHPSAMPPVPNYMPGQPYQQPYMYPNMQPVQRPAGPATYVVPVSRFFSPLSFYLLKKTQYFFIIRFLLLLDF